MGLNRELLMDMLVVVSGSVCYFSMGGIASNVGALTGEFVEAFNATRFEAAWVGSLNNGFTFGFSMVAVPIIEQLGFRTPMIVSCFLVTGCMLAATAVPTLSAIYVFFVLLGSSMSVIITGCTGYIGGRFQKRRTLAFGLISMGSGIGSVFFSFLVGWAARSYGYRGVLYLFSSLGGPLLLAMIAYFFTASEGEQSADVEQNGKKEKDGPKETDKLIKSKMNESVPQSGAGVNGLRGKDTTANDKLDASSKRSKNSILEYLYLFRDIRLVLFFWAYTFAHAAFIVVIVLAEDLLSVVFEVPKEKAEFVIVALTVGGFFGRAIVIAVSFFQVSHLIPLSVALTLFGCAEAVYPLTGYTTVCVLTGLGGAIFGYMVSVVPQIVIDVFGQKDVSRYIGVMFTSNGLGAAIGAPIAGVIKDHYSYFEAFYFGGGTMLVSVILFLCIAFHPRTRAMKEERSRLA